MAALLNFLRNRYPLDVSKVVENYDEFLQSALITTTSFHDILNRKLNKKNRTLQLTVLIYLFVYFFPKYFILCYSYTRDTETRVHYQYLLADYAEEMGLLGRTFNACYTVFQFENTVNSLFLRWYESTASLEFLTDWVHRTPGTSSLEKDFVDLDNEMKLKLITQLHYKTMIARAVARQTNFAIISYETIVFVMFLYNQRPSFVFSIFASFNWLTTILFFMSPGNHFHALYTSFIATTDYFVIRIQRLKERAIKLKTTQLTNHNLKEVLEDYDELVSVFNKYNKVLKHLLRNLVQFYAFGLTAAFFVFTLKTDAWMLAFIITSAAGYSMIILSTGIYISQLHSKIMQLHHELASIPARHSVYANVSLSHAFHLRLVIKELGNLKKEGQFVIGLRDGEGAATSRQEIFDLTMTTLGNTLMLMKFVIQSNI